MRSLKLASGKFAGTELPDHLQGRNQRPDFYWPIRHNIVGKEWSVGEAEFMWSDCVGEGKPFSINRNNDHALNQVVEAAAACLYLQIFSGKRDPLVLAFTLNRALV
jgi:hypothetical protein